MSGSHFTNGLQGVYELEPYHAEHVRLEAQELLAPSAILQNASAEGLDRVYWLRLEALAGRPVYIVKARALRGRARI